MTNPFDSDASQDPTAPETTLELSTELYPENPGDYYAVLEDRVTGVKMPVRIVRKVDKVAE